MKIFRKVRLQRLNYVNHILTYLVRCSKSKYVNALAKNSLNSALNYVKYIFKCVNVLYSKVRYVNTPPYIIGG